MSNIIHLPVIAGIEITTDECDRFNLNALHRASGRAKKNGPSYWLALESTAALINELDTDTGISVSTVNVVKGGKSQGSFCHQLLAVSYAGWISPAFQLKVNQAFIDCRAENVSKPKDLSSLLIAAGEELRARDEKIEVLEPKAKFCDQVAITDDAITVAEAAKLIGTGQNRLFAFLRKTGWLTRKNEPYQEKVESGCMEVKLSDPWIHPDHGLKRSITALVTGKGLVKLQKLWSDNLEAA